MYFWQVFYLLLFGQTQEFAFRHQTLRLEGELDDQRVVGDRRFRLRLVHQGMTTTKDVLRKHRIKKSNVDIADKYPQWEQGTGFKYKLKVNKKVHRNEWREGEPTLHYERTTAVTVDLNDSDK